MTKYILHGGRTSIKSEDNENFFKEIIKDLKSSAKILLIYFAKDESEWNELFDEDKENFNRANSDGNYTFILANKEKIIDQIRDADVIYMRGGETMKLQEQMSKIKNLKSLFNNKVIAGSSAGAQVLSQYYYLNEEEQIKKGLGILPIKTFCHYFKNQKELLKELEDYGEKLKAYAIPEQKFVVLYPDRIRN